MNIYIYRDFQKKSQSHQLLQIALKDFLGWASNSADLPIFKGEKGKPYVKIDDVYFNISHSHQVWVCAMDHRNLGIDVEVLRKRSFEKLANKYFSTEELAYIFDGNTLDEFTTDENIRTESAPSKSSKEKCSQELKLKRFFQVWTFKEAYAKLKGESIFENLNVNSSDRKALVGVNVKQLDLGQDIIATVAMEGTENYDQEDCLKILQITKG